MLEQIHAYYLIIMGLVQLFRHSICHECENMIWRHRCYDLIWTYDQASRYYLFEFSTAMIIFLGTPSVFYMINLVLSWLMWIMVWEHIVDENVYKEDYYTLLKWTHMQGWFWLVRGVCILFGI